MNLIFTETHIKGLIFYFQMEYRIACHACENGEFYEGVRALLIDKDQNPKWRYNSICQVPREFVHLHFEPLSIGGELVLNSKM